MTAGWAAAGRVMKGGGSFQAGPLEVEGVWPGPPWSGVCWNPPAGGSPAPPPLVLDWLAVRDRAGKSKKQIRKMIICVITVTAFTTVHEFWPILDPDPEICDKILNKK